MSATTPEVALSEKFSSSFRSIQGVRIVSTGFYVPDNVVLNSDLADLGCDAEWIIQRTGIEERRHCPAGLATSDLAYGAAIQCLERANVKPDEVDMIIVGTMTPDYYTPSASSLLQSRLGCAAAAMDINAACSGFMYSLVTGAQFVKGGCEKTVLVVGADKMTQVVDPEDKKTFPLFGDGAGAVLLRADDRVDDGNSFGILSYQLASHGELGSSLVIPGGGSKLPCSQEVVSQRLQYLKMEGRSVFKWAVRLIPEAVSRACKAAGIGIDEIDLLIPHQANRRIIDAALENLDVPAEKVFVNVDRYGNTSAGSIPISLHEAVMQGRIEDGDIVVLMGFGAGLSWGTAVIRW
jgi:3-oxoacyl-[acyl-carrier-protein] synthase III